MSQIVTMRAEEHGHDPAHRGRYDAVVARAVAALPVLSEYCLPLLRIGGRFVAPKGADGAAEAASCPRRDGTSGRETCGRCCPSPCPASSRAPWW